MQAKVIFLLDISKGKNKTILEQLRPFIMYTILGHRKVLRFWFCPSACVRDMLTTQDKHNLCCQRIARALGNLAQSMFGKSGLFAQD